MTTRKYVADRQRTLLEALASGQSHYLELLVLKAKLEECDGFAAILESRSQKDRPSLEQAS